MKKYPNIYYRAARFLTWIPPDMATYLLAILDRPELLLASFLWFLNFVRNQLFVELLLRIWRKVLVRVRQLFLPPEDRIGPPLHDCLELEELRQEVADLKDRISELGRKPQEN